MMRSDHSPKFTARLSILLTVAVALATAPLAAQTSIGNAITYSRSGLKIDGDVLDGTYDLRFKLFTEAEAGTQIGELVQKNNVTIDKGVLKPTTLNFGPDVFTGEALYLEIKARKGNQSFQSTGPRERLRPVPFALSLPGFCTQQNDVCPNIIGGFAGNVVADGVVGATISGGGRVDDENVIGASGGTIGGGSGNTTNGSSATVAGGEDNSATGSFSTIAGGRFNAISGVHSTIGGGESNTVTGFDATVPGGSFNLAAGHYSFAAGRRAKAGFDGSFVWADSTDADFFASGADGFFVRCSGGVRFNTNSNLTSGVVCFGGGSSWSSVSDRNAKTNVQDVDSRQLLERLCAIPITTWNYKAQDESIRHIGPMAQDFHAAFGVGESDKLITTIDADGVLFAAIQGLHQIVCERDAEIARQRDQLAALAAELRDLKVAVEQMRELSKP